jgi:hypothetical protein
MRAITAAHYEAQLGIRARVLRQLWLVWALFSPDDIESSWERIEPAVLALTLGGAQQSAALSATYYRMLRQIRGVRGEAPVRLAQLRPEDVLFFLMLAGPRTAQALRATGRLDVFEQTFATLAGQVARSVLDGGRQTITDSVAADRQAVGYTRLTGAKPCAFCAMLASRGPVYKTAASAEQRSRDNDAYHLHCACTAEPVYSHDDPWPGRAREFRDMWNSLDGDRLAFRRQLERA